MSSYSKERWKHCGVLIVLNGKSVVTMVDRRFGQLTDPGGTRRHYEDPLRAALRECAEETRGIFDFRDKYRDFKRTSFSIITEDQFHLVVDVDLDEEECVDLSRRYSLSFTRGRNLAKRGIFADGLGGTRRETLENSFMMAIKFEVLERIVERGAPSDNLLTPWDSSPIELDCRLLKFLGRGKTHYPCVYSRVSRIFTRLAHLFNGYPLLRDGGCHCDSCADGSVDSRKPQHQDENSVHDTCVPSLD